MTAQPSRFPGLLPDVPYHKEGYYDAGPPACGFYEESYLSLHPSLHEADLPYKLAAALSMLAGPLAGVTFGSIADLGCGSGLLLKGILDYLEERRALRPPALAIDVSAAILRRGTFDSRVTRLRASCENIPLEDSSLSLATCMDVLEHLEYPDRAAREIARVASYCIVKTPLERSFYTLVRGGRRRLARLRSRYGHIHHFDRASLLAILSPHFHILAEDHLPIPDRSRPMAALQRTLLTISPALLYDRLFGGFLVLALRSKHHRTP